MNGLMYVFSCVLSWYNEWFNVLFSCVLSWHNEWFNVCV